VKIYIPGQGAVDSSVYRVHCAVNAYDQNLSFKLNEEYWGLLCLYAYAVS
jgi:hypothetical protein